jgi:hypothetical protein
MDEIQKELQQEEELLKPSKEEEVRAKVIEKFGLDEVDHAALIDNLVKDRLEDQKRFGEVVGQKRKIRDERDELKKQATAPKKEAVDPDEVLKKATEAVKQEFEQRDLNDLGLPDEIKAEVQAIAKAKNISVRQAAQEPYIKFKKDEWEKEQKTNEAAISRNNKTAATQTFDPAKPPKLDPSIDPNTKEGQEAIAKYRKESDAWMEQAKKQG